MGLTEAVLSGISAAGQTEAENIEAELNALVREGFSERSAMAFVTTVMAIRKISSSATVEGVFEVALLLGLEELLDRMSAEGQTARKSPTKRKPRKSGAVFMT